ncbi:S41 family peptidase [Chitinophaga qingshengii]|uniref:Peptidase S41 n=1 Tax=Chitinophaga qingshengii TaxID=1569794 RepID=A0ABR7TMM5_9BACT|nr:S41 family peptidase [Chitinophaga qingshengii]MBC9931248.1 hypothetical protein [Chitinophaga qingshengii]
MRSSFRPFFLGSIVLIAACRKKEDISPAPTGPVTQQEINNWVLDSMRYFYLWNDQLPANPDKSADPFTFFSSIKNISDRFSLLYNPEDPATYAHDIRSKYGIDFSIISWPQRPEGVMGVIKLVVPGSYAAAAGLKRGSYFTRINETSLTADNAAGLSEQLRTATTGTLTPATVTGNNIIENIPVQLQGKQIVVNPVYTSAVVSTTPHKTGYIFYNAFIDGYNTNLLETFSKLKSQGITELIIDIRYNTGGSLAAAAMLTALIAPDITENNVFVQYSGNSRLGSRTLNFATALSVPENADPVSFGALQSARLQLPRVFLLTGSQTVSAAELLINNLKPYTKVIQIGETTVGKDKGAVIVKDMRSPRRIPWVLQPITYRLSNASGNGNYTQGIAPQYPVDEMSSLPLLPLGDASDPLIAKALAIISGGGRASTENHHFTRHIYDAAQPAVVNSMVIIPK